jgi:hypothetical protein
LKLVAHEQRIFFGFDLVSAGAAMTSAQWDRRYARACAAGGD